MESEPSRRQYFKIYNTCQSIITLSKRRCARIFCYQLLCVHWCRPPRTPDISIWCGVFVDRRLWKAIITDSGVPLGEFDSHAEKGSCGKNVIRPSRYNSSDGSRPRSSSGTCGEVPCDAPPDRRAFTSGMNRHLSQASETAGQTKSRAGDFERDCQIISRDRARQAIMASFQAKCRTVLLLDFNSEPGGRMEGISEVLRYSKKQKLGYELNVDTTASVSRQQGAVFKMCPRSHAELAASLHASLNGFILCVFVSSAHQVALLPAPSLRDTFFFLLLQSRHSSRKGDDKRGRLILLLLAERSIKTTLEYLRYQPGAPQVLVFVSF